MAANRITESAIEQFAIELLEKSGYQYVYGPDLAPDSEHPERQYGDVVLVTRVRDAIDKLDPTLPNESE